MTTSWFVSLEFNRSRSPLPKSVKTINDGLSVCIPSTIFWSIHLSMRMRKVASSRVRALPITPAAAKPSASRCETT